MDQTSPLAHLSADDLLARGASLLGESRASEALQCFDAFLARFSGTEDRDRIAYAQFERAELLRQRARYRESAAAYQQVLDLVDGDPESLRYLRLQCLWGKADDLQRLGETVESAAALAELIGRYSDDPAPGARAWVAHAYICQGWLAQQAGAINTAVTAFDAAIRHASPESEPGLRDLVAKARRHRATVLKLKRERALVSISRLIIVVLILGLAVGRLAARRGRRC